MMPLLKHSIPPSERELLQSNDQMYWMLTDFKCHVLHSTDYMHLQKCTFRIYKPPSLKVLQCCQYLKLCYSLSLFLTNLIQSHIKNQSNKQTSKNKSCLSLSMSNDQMVAGIRIVGMSEAL